MDEYSIVFARSARKELVALPAKLAQRVLTNIEGLQRDPHPPGSRKLEGSVDLWRIRNGTTEFSMRLTMHAALSRSSRFDTGVMPTAEVAVPPSLPFQP